MKPAYTDILRKLNFEIAGTSKYRWKPITIGRIMKSTNIANQTFSHSLKETAN